MERREFETVRTGGVATGGGLSTGGGFPTGGGFTTGGGLSTGGGMSAGGGFARAGGLSTIDRIVPEGLGAENEACFNLCWCFGCASKCVFVGLPFIVYPSFTRERFHFLIDRADAFDVFFSAHILAHLLSLGMAGH